MQIMIVGLSHKTAPVETRELLAVQAFAFPNVMRELMQIDGVSEGVILSTCNRTEIYAVVDRPREAAPAMINLLSRDKVLDKTQVRSHFYVKLDDEAVEHLFRVACGLDSMVLGETQILGQVKEAYTLSRNQGSVGKILHTLFNHATAVGKRAQAETTIGQSAVSVSYAAVELARKVFASLEGRKVLVIGAGETAELTVKHLVSGGVKAVVVANRTLQRAEDLAGQYGGIPICIEDIGRWLPEVDVVISSTGAPHLVLRRETVQEAMRQRRGKPIFLFDIAVPRDIDPEAGRLDNVFLYDIDDLQSVVEANLRERAREAKKVERFIEEEQKKFQNWLRTLDVVPIIRSLREKIEGIRRAEMEKALAKLPDLTEKERAVIEAMTAVMVNKILNDPTVRIKEYAAEANGSVYLDAVSQLFNLNPSKAEDQPAGVAEAGAKLVT